MKWTEAVEQMRLLLAEQHKAAGATGEPPGVDQATGVLNLAASLYDNLDGRDAPAMSDRTDKPALRLLLRSREAYVLGLLDLTGFDVERILPDEATVDIGHDAMPADTFRLTVRRVAP